MADLEHIKDATRKIEKCYCAYKDKQMFRLLKYAICTAEHSLTYDIMKKINPAEAELLHDPVFKARIRFRFSGPDFPPHIVFKIYIRTDGKGVKYLSGKRAIKPASKAAVDSLVLMGNRRFLDQMILDSCHSQARLIPDELGVANLKDCVKYMTNLDESPASIGGRGNTWRKLSLHVLPRHHVIYDVVTYIQQNKMTSKMKDFLYVNHPVSQDEQLTCYHSINKRKRSPREPQSSSRRSKQTQKRVAQMRHMYGLDDARLSPDKFEANIPTQHTTSRNSPIECGEMSFEGDDWDEEGKLLFEWTQELTLDKLESSSDSLAM